MTSHSHDAPLKAAATTSRTGERRIVWAHVISVLSVTVLIVAEVFGVAYAFGWAVGHILEAGESAKRLIQGAFLALGAAFAAFFVNRARRIEPFTLPR